MGAALTRWRSVGQPTKEELESIFRDEGLRPSWWSNAPGDRYSAHSHPYHNVSHLRALSHRYALTLVAEEARVA